MIISLIHGSFEIKHFQQTIIALNNSIGILIMLPILGFGLIKLPELFYSKIITEKSVEIKIKNLEECQKLKEIHQKELTKLYLQVNALKKQEKNEFSNQINKIHYRLHPLILQDLQQEIIDDKSNQDLAKV